MTVTPTFARRRGSGAEAPVELRFVDMLLIIIATLVFVTILLSAISAFSGGGRPDTAPKITTESAPDAITGQRYQLTLAAAGGDGDFTWKAVDGELPEGLELTEDGAVEGTPETEESREVGIQVKDGSGRSSATRQLRLRVLPSGADDTKPLSPRIADTVALIPSATAGQSYKFTFDVDGREDGYVWKLVKGSLPKGLKLSADGTLAGQPGQDGTFTATVAMTGDGGRTQQRIRIDVEPEPDSTLWKILEWVGIVFTWIGWIVLGLIILSIIKVILFGRPGRVVEETEIPGLFGRRRY